MGGMFPPSNGRLFLCGSHQVDLAYNDRSFLGLTLVKNPIPTK